MRKLGLILLLIIALNLLLMARHAGTPPSHSEGVARIGGTFILTDTHGHTVNESGFRGKPMLVYMGYSNCPDICPMTLTAMGSALTLLGNDSSKLSAVFITLDPARDTPATLEHYLSAFNPQIIGLTGSQDAIAAVVKAYKGYSKKVPAADGGHYLVDHSGFIYLMDAQGKYVTHFQPDAKAQDIAAAVKKLL